MLKGYTQRTDLTRLQAAWSVSHLLIAAGCKPETVTPNKLLGKKEHKQKQKTIEAEQLPIDELFKLMKREG